MSDFFEQVNAASQRYEECRPQREQQIRLIRSDQPFLADSRHRVQRWFRRRGYSDEVAELATTTGEVPQDVLEVMSAQQEVGLERVLGTADFVGVAFLEHALRVSRTVCRIAIGGRSGSPNGFGTGFLVSPRLLLTNNHVLGSATEAAGSVAEFDYYVRPNGTPASVRVFTLDPDTFFLTDAALDFTLVAVSEQGNNGIRLRDFGWNQLIPEEGKAIIGQWVNIIQHPSGEPKQLVLRNNEIVDTLRNFLHYITDTSPGSSGSPVFNERWEVVALHHSGVPRRDAAGNILDIHGRRWNPQQGEHRIKWLANEGVRISKVVGFVNAASLSAAKRALFQQSLQAPPLELLASGNDAATPAGEPRGSSFAMQSDGTAVWTIPLQLSVRMGGSAMPQEVPASTLASTTAVAAAAGPDLKDERAVLEAARREFASRPDVLDVRLGYRFENGWITKERAIVVKVREKKSHATLDREGTPALVSSFAGYPLQVTGPTIHDLVREAMPGTRETLRELTELRALEILYQPPANGKLLTVNAPMTANFHVSPDAGWPHLEDFIKRTRKSLVVGMFDFGAEHIVKAIEKLKKPSFKELLLVIQKGESIGTGTKKDDLTDEAVVERLGKRFGKRFQFGWVKIGKKNGWVASSYHIKVAVRDHTAFWLSSGNWQSSNQPEVDLAGKKSKDFSFLQSHNREWHAVIEHPGLAATFESYLRHDHQNGTAEAFTESLSALPLLELPLLEKFTPPAHPQFKYFAPLPLKKQTLRITPLLTPDNYFDALIALVAGAKREILLQNQTFNAPKSHQAKLVELMELLAEKQKHIPVRIVFRLFHTATTRENLDALQDAGFDTDSIKVQTNLHTKGVIVDDETVLIGSHNISDQGITINRDASLLIEDARVAAYFKGLFQHDWDNLAMQDIGTDFEADRATRGGPKATGACMVLTPKEYLELL
jgi:V8-like Glu-specific endopeptidase